MPVGHYSDAEPSVGSRRRTVALVLPDLSLELRTDTGVFSHHGVDYGTRLLLTRAPAPPPAGDLLDLGCGYGPMAVALARRAPGVTIWAVDVNRRAVALTAENALAAGVTNVRAVAPEEVPAAVRFAAIWSNPPVHIGKVALRQLLVRWLGRLAPGGRAALVVHRHLGADSLARWLGAEGFPIRRFGSRRGYRLLESGPREPPVTPAPEDR